MDIDPHGAGQMPKGALIAHILSRYHDTHRRELPDLLALARKVETAHATDPDTPHGPAQGREAMIADLEDHMGREEADVFDRFETGDALPGHATAGPRHDHEGYKVALDRLAAITHGFRLPRYACRSGARLYAGLGKLAEDLDEHKYLEDSVLFPRLQAGR